MLIRNIEIAMLTKDTSKKTLRMLICTVLYDCIIMDQKKQMWKPGGLSFHGCVTLGYFLTSGILGFLLCNLTPQVCSEGSIR